MSIPEFIPPRLAALALERRWHSHPDHTPEENRAAIAEAHAAYWRMVQTSSDAGHYSSWPQEAYEIYIREKAEQCAKGKHALYLRLCKKRT